VPHEKFDLSRLERLNDESRFKALDPRVLWAALDTPAPDVIVEIGAGTGLFASRFAAMAPQATVYAVDMEPEMVAWMSDNRPEVATGALIPLLSSETAVPLPDGCADVVMMLNVHHELAKPDTTYAQAARLLRSGGRILVADWSPEAVQERPPVHVRATAAQLAAALTGSGFKDVIVHEGLPSHCLVTASQA